VVWAADLADPFALHVVGGGGLAPGLRFPGQYYQPETGLYYNYHRDYDPDTGRYLQPDPIGLAGGLNPYVYANANPLRYIDPFGLEVTLWKRPVDIGPSGIVGWIPGANHQWIKTDTLEAGMGPWDPNNSGQVPGQDGRKDRPGDPTQTVDHTGQSDAPNAEQIPLPHPVEEECINRCIRPGQDTGAWGPDNNCWTFVDDCLERCRNFPKNPRSQ